MQDKGMSRRNTAALILVLIVVTAYYVFTQQGAPSFRFFPESRTFTLTGAKDKKAVFSLDDLTELRLYAGGDYGTALDGGKLPLGGVRYGTWESESLGRYEAFFSDKTDVVILVKDADKTAVFNIENEDSTRELLRQMDKMM